MIDEPPPQAEPAAAPLPFPNVPERALHAPHRPIFTRRRVWIASLTVAVLITGGGLVLLSSDDTSYQDLDRTLSNQNDALTGRNAILQGQLTATQGSLADARTQLAAATAELRHPHLGIWNVAQEVRGPSYYLAAGVPDTFTYHLHLTSNGPMNVSILSFEQFQSAIVCIYRRVGDTNHCMHNNGSAMSWANQTTIDYEFHEAEGCAAYMLVITSSSPITVTPNVSVTYNPASQATGSCG